MILLARKKNHYRWLEKLFPQVGADCLLVLIALPAIGTPTLRPALAILIRTESGRCEAHLDKGITPITVLIHAKRDVRLVELLQPLGSYRGL